MRKTFLLFQLLLVSYVSHADFFPRNFNIDIARYDFNITIFHDSDRIEGRAIITGKVLSDTTVLVLNLVNQDVIGNGMKITNLKGNFDLNYEHLNNVITIKPNSGFKKEQHFSIEIEYEGIPKDGLVISKNKYGEKTFFGDNYPDRARNWIPCVDHLYEKAQVAWNVVAPNYFQVIANGKKIEETNIDEKQKLTRWFEAAPIPPKVMVIGAAKFSVMPINTVESIPVSAWVYPQNAEEGLNDYGISTRAMEYFIDRVGPYSYEKLANVQSKTRYGGMENASNIFYYENSVTGQNTIEPLIAHEVAHQWFGNSASENDWHHVWLSEGFATYFTHLYIEEFYGSKQMATRLKEDREKVIGYYKSNPAPVVNTTIKDYNRILNPNSYQKGGWVLHMLRNKVGDELFWKSIQNYYTKYQNKNAMTKDLEEVFEETCSLNLDEFFQQWIFTAGHPELEISWEKVDEGIEVSIKQRQKTPFEFPIEIEIIQDQNNSETKLIAVSKKSESFILESKLQVNDLKIDPNTRLLFEEVESNK